MNTIEKMTYYIRIDGRTLRKNPTPPGVKKYIPGRKTITATIYGSVPDYVKNSDACRWQSTQFDSEHGAINVYSIESLHMAEKIVDQIRDKKLTADLDVWQDKIDVTTDNEQPYFYNYINQTLKCVHCGAELKYKELEHRYSDCGEYFITKICPHCGESECVDIDHESVNAYLLRTGKKESDIPYAKEDH